MTVGYRNKLYISNYSINTKDYKRKIEIIFKIFILDGNSIVIKEKDK